MTDDAEIKPILNTDDTKLVEDITYSKGKAMLLFLLMGIAPLAMWNAMLSVFGGVIAVFPGFPISSTVPLAQTIPNFALNGIMAFRLFPIGKGGVTNFRDSCLIFVVLSFLVPYACTYAAGSAYGSYMVYAASALAGCLAALTLSGLFAMASVLPDNYSGLVSVGLGASGIIPFFTVALFDLPNSTRTMWILFSVAAFWNIVGAICCELMRREKWTKPGFRVLQHHKLGGMEDVYYKPDPEAGVGIAEPQQSRFRVFAATWMVQMSVFLVFVQTFIVFPGPSVLLDTENPKFAQYIIGIFQIGDFLGRQASAYGLNMRKEGLFLTVLLRFAVVPLFWGLLNYNVQKWAVLFAVEFVMAFTNGSLSSNCFMVGPDYVTATIEKGEASRQLVFFNCAGMCAGSVVLTILCAFKVFPQ